MESLDNQIISEINAKYTWDDIVYENSKLSFMVINGVVLAEGTVKDDFTYDYLHRSILEIPNVQKVKMEVKITDSIQRPTLNDKEMAKLLEYRLRHDPQLKYKGLKVNVHNGNLTLVGKVKSKLDKLIAKSIVKSNVSTKSINDELVVGL